MSNFTPITRDLYRRALLIQLYDARHALGVETLCIGQEAAGFMDHATAETVQAEMAYLEGKYFVARRTSTLSAARVEWALTAAGTDYLEGNHYV